MSAADVKDNLRDVACAVVDESAVAQKEYGDFASMHEAYGVLREEVDELWDAIKANQKIPERKDWIRAEAIQIASVAMRIAEQAGRVLR